MVGQKEFAQFGILVGLLFLRIIFQVEFSLSYFYFFILFLFFLRNQ